MDGSAGSPPILRLTTSDVEARYRPQLIGDVMARELAGGEISAAGDAALGCDWRLAGIGPGTVIADAVQSGLRGARGPVQVRDSDDDLTFFFGRDGVARFEQNDRRELLQPGEAVVVAHARPCYSEWPANRVRVLRVPRGSLPFDTAIEKAGGVRLPAQTPALALLGSYVNAVWTLAVAGSVPAIAERHLSELATLALAAAAGTDIPALARGAAVQAARLATMREHVARNYTNPGLTMAKTAAAAGLSERNGYLVFAAAGIGFSDMLFALRLDRAREMLAGGYIGRLVDLAFAVGFSDLSHFNRRFRSRFGATPGDIRNGSAHR